MFPTKKEFGEYRIGTFNSIEFNLPLKGCEHFDSHPFIFLVPAELYAEAECFTSKGKFDFLYICRGLLSENICSQVLADYL